MYELVAIGVVFVAASAIGFVMRRPPRKRATRIADVEAGKRVCIRGAVHATGVLSAPYTARRCVYWRLYLRVDARIGDVQEVARACDFEIRDGSGAAQVLAERAVFDVVADIVEIDRASALSHRALSILAEHGFDVPQIANVELCEAVIAVGDALEVIGEAVLEPSREAAAIERGYRDQQPFVPVFSGAVEVHGEHREPIYRGRRG